MERNKHNADMRRRLLRTVDLLDANPQLEPVVMIQRGVVDACYDYIDPSGWEADGISEPEIRDVRRGYHGAIWTEAPKNNDGWPMINYDDAKPERVLLIPVY